MIRPALWEDGELSLHPHETVNHLYVLGDGANWITLHRADIREIERATA